MALSSHTWSPSARQEVEYISCIPEMTTGWFSFIVNIKRLLYNSYLTPFFLLKKKNQNKECFSWLMWKELKELGLMNIIFSVVLFDDKCNLYEKQTKEITWELNGRPYTVQGLKGWLQGHGCRHGKKAKFCVCVRKKMRGKVLGNRER